MVLTRSFKATLMERTRRDPAFRRALLAEAMNVLMEGDIDTGKSALRDYINATVGFQALSTAVGTPPKSLMRMFGPSGNPTARNLFAVVAYLQRELGVTLEAARA